MKCTIKYKSVVVVPEYIDRKVTHPPLYLLQLQLTPTSIHTKLPCMYIRIHHYS